MTKTLEELQQDSICRVEQIRQDACGDMAVLLDNTLTRLRFGERASIVLTDSGANSTLPEVKMYLYNLASWAYAEEVIVHRMCKYDVKGRVDYARKQRN